MTADYFDRLPSCLDCGRILDESARLEDGRRECRRCRGVYHPAEVFAHV